MNGQITPKGDNVLLQIIETEVTPGGIIIPEKARSNMRDAVMGRVLAVGPGRVTEYGTKIEVDVKPGDFVLLMRSAGVVIEHEKATMRVVRCGELLCNVEESRIIAPRDAAS